MMQCAPVHCIPEPALTLTQEPSLEQRWICGYCFAWGPRKEEDLCLPESQASELFCSRGCLKSHPLVWFEGAWPAMNPERPIVPRWLSEAQEKGLGFRSLLASLRPSQKLTP